MQSATEQNKRTALEQLRFHRQNNLTRSAPPNPPSTPPSTFTVYAPPSQLRDATVPSRFFHNATSVVGNVLVPSSSPLGPEHNGHPYSHLARSDVAAGPSNSLSFTQPYDPLSAPSFLPRQTQSQNNLRRQLHPENGDPYGPREEGPPRKKLNLGTTTTSNDIISPPPRRIVRGGRGRRAGDAISVPPSDGEDYDMRIEGSPKVNTPASRIIPSESPMDDPNFIRFKLTMPIERPDRILAAWEEARGDDKQATKLLDDTSWTPRKSKPPTPKSTEKDNFGRVQEIEEANKAQRVATKEKGKKSMIYANRPVLEVKPVSSATPAAKRSHPASATPFTPDTPLLRPARRQRLKKVVHSDSDSNFASSDNESENETTARTAEPDTRALDYLNAASSEAIQELTGCTPQQADIVIGLRPFDSIDDLNTKLGQGKKKAGPGGISSRMFEDCQTIFSEYGAVDTILDDCEKIGTSLRNAIASWTSALSTGEPSSTGGNPEDGALTFTSINPSKKHKHKDYLSTQPQLLSDTVQLKEYQMLGVNWLNLLYRRNLSCILADEMGLGKTVQVISFLAHLKEQGNKGPHLVVVPSSTLENWCREFARFAPSINIQTYYGSKDERILLRQTLLDSQCRQAGEEGWDVLVTTYNLAQGDDKDRKFFRKVDWDCSIFDEGHVLKNYQSQRYRAMLKVGSKWRLLLTGTPLQNNLQELVSLMNFILPDQFAGSLESLRTIFRVKGDSKVSLLGQERVSRAKKMMTPFVLRRRKDQVLNDLPKKTERIEWCIMTDTQKAIYTDTLQRSRKTILEATPATSGAATPVEPAPSKKKKGAQDKPKIKAYLENSTNVLMDLRKAASHPMLFRKLFTDTILSSITKQLLKEPDFKKRGALYEIVKEDMSVMTDAELQIFCGTYKSTRQYLQDLNCYQDAGKVQVLLKLLAEYKKENRKVLIFSQFTQVLDILQKILKQESTKFLVLTGSTPVDVRQSLVDEFTEDDSIQVFLLSTKAGGMGINLTAASVVIMFDQDFNPHNDKQAQDRAYRIGQKRDVDVVKLISRGTIEEDMLRLGETKLALDEAVAGSSEEKDDSAPEREMKMSLMKTLRQQYEMQQEGTDQA